jgi:8-oxo-dGTP diphosphatase
MTEYVLGFAFDSNEEVVLIRKNKPDWQRGLLNGVGGKIEENESSYAAMVREFHEETGVRLHGWDNFARMEFREVNVVHCYA